MEFEELVEEMIDREELRRTLKERVDREMDNFFANHPDFEDEEIKFFKEFLLKTFKSAFEEK